MNPDEIILPFVHSNGTSADELSTLRQDLYNALDAAVAALKQMAPNGRDYYLEPGRHELAFEQHMRRMKALTGMMAEMEHEIGMIYEASKR